MAPAGLRPEEDRVGRQASCLHPASGDDGMANEAVPVVQVQRQREVWGTNIPIALVGAPDAGRLREDRHGLSWKVARDPAAIALSSPGRPVETANAG